MTRPEEDAKAGASVDVVGGGEFAGYQAYKANQEISGDRANDSSDVVAKSKI